MGIRKASIGSAAALLLLGLLIQLPLRLSGIAVTVHDVECVYEFVQFEGDTVSGNFVAIDHDVFWGSDHPGVDLIVYSPRGDTVHTSKGKSGDKFEFKAPSNGMYKFCFHNPSKIPESISFNIHVGHIPSEQHLAKNEHLDPVNVKIAELRESLESVTLEQRYLKAREARHRLTNESTRRRLIFYTVLEYVALMLASVLQIWYIRGMFSKTVAYNRV
ncbi:transmembrane emp24 domain-containing protein p24beta3-like [Phalaenopsis equestris]|uniref:transmembrane emp24 domain-containing protein p24beta3-like n=1 Tax=Phalaenopsis equestris TaxID=78828 RepID=UPI0009E4EA48|nr:transmembrane emp24 domain-containing protein p24beta3-like [Phalaenopsis equestris]